MRSLTCRTWILIASAFSASIQAQHAPAVSTSRWQGYGVPVAIAATLMGAYYLYNKKDPNGLPTVDRTYTKTVRTTRLPADGTLAITKQAAAEPRVERKLIHLPIKPVLSETITYRPHVPLNRGLITQTTLVEELPAIDVQDALGNTALITAVKQNNYDQVKQLLTDGANPNIQNNRGMTALMFNALVATDGTITQLLIDHGTNVNLQDDKGKTALMYATENIGPLIKQAFGDPVIGALIEHGNADITITDHEGRTALEHLPDMIHSKKLKIRRKYLREQLVNQQLRTENSLKKTEPEQKTTSDTTFTKEMINNHGG